MTAASGSRFRARWVGAKNRRLQFCLYRLDVRIRAQVAEKCEGRWPLAVGSKNPRKDL